jgi:O6-methylguanine-DNA--protein-cysteine methyltransferase
MTTNRYDTIIVGADGKLHSYGGGDGLPTKEWLLKMEGAVIA